MPYRSYSISEDRQPRVEIVKTSEFQHGGEKAWVSVGGSLSGRVFDIGGKQNPNVHVVISDSGKDLVIQATEQQLGDERENQLYKEVTLGMFRLNRTCGRKLFATFGLLEFLPQATDVDENALQLLWERRREALEGRCILPTGLVRKTQRKQIIACASSPSIAEFPYLVC